MITANSKLYTVKVYDLTLERKMANNFLKLLETTYQEVEEQWNVTISAIVTDASGETHKACYDFVWKNSSVVVLDCYAHQINLIVGNYFKHGCTSLKYTDMAEELIFWIQSKTMLLGLIQEEQIRQNKQPTTIICPVLTCWTAHLCAYQCLLSTKSVLIAVVATEVGKDEANRLFTAGGDSKTKLKAKRMMNIIQDPLFWSSLQQVTHHLEPLGAAANVIQVAFCWLDTVLITFGYLFHMYSEMMIDYPEDEDACTEIISSLEQCWSKADQEPFIACLILNPLYQLSPFSPHIALHTATALGLMK
ncbi:hypothetical protein AN958_04588 [Leucoagaricus sp. SymC.cos]|nr:hypothetical protein AN958_04588 [Leucoagaricus sp. SymC.cos]